MHVQSQAPSLQRPAAFAVPAQVVSRRDRRTRQLAAEMVRLNGETIEGATRVALRAAGFSPYELDEMGADAEHIANGMFVRQDHVEPEPITDEQLLEEALALHRPMLDRLLVKLRARPHFNEDALARLWPKIATGLATRVATSPLPKRLEAVGLGPGNGGGF